MVVLAAPAARGLEPIRGLFKFKWSASSWRAWLRCIGLLFVLVGLWPGSEIVGWVFGVGVLALTFWSLWRSES